MTGLPGDLLGLIISIIEDRLNAELFKHSATVGTRFCQILCWVPVYYNTVTGLSLEKNFVEVHSIQKSRCLFYFSLLSFLVNGKK